MAISDANKKFIQTLIQHYVSEPEAYSEIVEAYSPKSELAETTVGFVIGMIYSGFLRAYADQNLKINSDDIEEFNYRLGHDEDRQKSNYMDKNENGHVSNKKTKIHISG